ncbi:EscS/YscS/HrcS family type III secretion system export apparatus protein [Parashewanella spongiae]|uniref:EscS/YscS/HrcS family type III secretion system export apparatus protein n=1 Tax=Parashewanella spongiae TaxID=342950 RepID=A0A3A6TX27_9GAMM|nr:type III secretion system export apparatus subunit SctS [Parashewanella spongiae]MCL1077854.1 type III secretion system export apparatus subunit SctS [Parashewanella spongiae]RJY17625.1 EscS/YscS/HrcS family type III secretion system export apparatus protein [Parashewanella spongiae]
MNQTELIHLTSELLWITLLLSLPTVLVASILGIAVSLVQALTQIQDQTLQFLIKLVGVSIVMVMTYNWMGVAMLNYANHVFDLISQVGG